MDIFTFDVPMPVWHVVNGCVDNSIAVDVEGIEARAEETVEIGNRVMQAGWRAAAAHPEADGSGGWPPDGAILPVALRRSDWDWALSQVERWHVHDGSADLVKAIGFLRRELSRTSASPDDRG